MVKPRFYTDRIKKEIRKSFPKADIINYKKIIGGLVSPTFKVEIKSPKKILAVKVYKTKNAKMIETNNSILDYLTRNSLPAPKVYSNALYKTQGVTVMEFIPGINAQEYYIKSSERDKQKLLFYMGKLIKKIHSLETQKFWNHYKHEIRNEEEWETWTICRIEKYLNFFKENMEKKYYLFLKNKFEILKNIKSKDIKLAQLHWDYHLKNVLVNNRGKIIGVFDFDNAMKGDILAELGQTKYWLIFELDDYRNFDCFLKGYNRKFSSKEKEIIDAYCLLHLAAVTRSIWPSKERLGWIIEKHKKMLEREMK